MEKYIGKTLTFCETAQKETSLSSAFEPPSNGLCAVKRRDIGCGDDKSLEILVKSYLFTFTLVAVLLPHSLPPLSLSLSLSSSLSLSPVHAPQVHSLTLSYKFFSSPALSLSHFTGTLIDPCFFELMIQLKSRMKLKNIQTKNLP